MLTRRPILAAALSGLIVTSGALGGASQSTTSRLAFTSMERGYQLMSMSRTGDDVRRVSITGAVDLQGTLSPDRTKIAFVSMRDGNPELYVVSADGSGAARRLTNHPAWDGDPDWSPDSLRIAFESERDDADGDVFVVNADGSALTKLAARTVRRDPTVRPVLGNRDLRHPGWWRHVQEPTRVPPGRLIVSIGRGDEIWVTTWSRDPGSLYSSLGRLRRGRRAARSSRREVSRVIGPKGGYGAHDPGESGASATEFQNDKAARKDGAAEPQRAKARGADGVVGKSRLRLVERGKPGLVDQRSARGRARRSPRDRRARRTGGGAGRGRGSSSSRSSAPKATRRVPSAPRPSASRRAGGGRLAPARP